MPWHRIALRSVAWVYQVEKDPIATITHSSRMRIVCPAFKKWSNFPTEINSSSLIEHKNIRSLSNHLRFQSIRSGIGQMDI